MAEHRLIADPEIHEPKGVAGATANRAYIADGAGSGAWDQVDSNTLKGAVTNSTVAGRRVITDGTGGFDTDLTPASAFGTMNLSDNTTGQIITVAADTSLNDDADFQVLTQVFDFDSLQNMTSGGNFLEIDQAGIYVIDFWANVKVNAASTNVALKFVVNDVDFVARSPRARISESGELYGMSANGIHTFSAGDQIKLAVAANKGVTMTFEDLTFQLLFLAEV